MLRHSLELARASLLQSHAGTLAVQGSSSLAALWPASALAASEASCASAGLAAAGSQRHYSGANLTLPRLRGMFADLPVVSNMLPTRKAFTLQWAPHGFGFVPKTIPPLPTIGLPLGAPKPASAGAANADEKQVQMMRRVFGGRGSHAQSATQPAEQALASLHAALMPVPAAGAPARPTPIIAPAMVDHNAEDGLLAVTNKIKTWRRLKMKKHKIRKRRKLNRHKDTK
mmetsp:Transcript_5164/g.12716  ORF Transcript_5164/g.12716 Transcript_5164/m.12716 type:complete len:228 (-) Transcript_5164:570-1253(-)